MANLFLTGSGVPTNAVGEVTDYYRDTTTNLIYYRAALGWESVPSLVPTPDGVGTNWLFGTGAPDNGIGSANDYYRDDANGSVYRKHAVNGWEAKGSLDFIGVYGVQWGEGTGAPSNTTYLNNLPAGSFYLDVATSDIYYKDNTLTWSLKGQLGGGGGGGANAFPRYDASQSLSTAQKAQLATNMGVFDPTINTQTGTSYTVGTVTTDNDGKTLLRMNNAAANTALVTTAQTLPISIRQAGAGTTTLVAGAGVTLNGTLAFTAQHQTKTIVPLSSGVYDVVG